MKKSKIKIQLLKNRLEILLLTEKFNSMATKTDEILTGFANRLDAATNELAKDFKDIRDQLAALQVDPAVLGRFDSGITTLENMGKDPVNPV